MATHDLNFAEAVGGFPDDGNQGNAAAITDNTAEFYIDAGKSENFETMIVSNTSAGMTLLDYGTVDGLEVMIKNGYGTEEATVQLALYHQTDGEFTSNIELDPPDTSGTTITVGGPTQLWGKNWSNVDINEIEFKFHSPVEPAGGIALRGTFVRLRVYHTPTKVPGKLNVQGLISLNSGIINL